MKKKLLFCLALVFVIMSCNDKKPEKKIANNNAPFQSQTIDMTHPRISKIYDSSLVVKYDPFIVYNDGSFMVACEIEDFDLLAKYDPIFYKYNYLGNGYTWSAISRQILEKENPMILNHLQFDPEAGGFYLFARNEEYQIEVAKILSNIFADLSKLEEVVKTADRSRIPK